jgi:hypothetical protein
MLDYQENMERHINKDLDGWIRIWFKDCPEGTKFHKDYTFRDAKTAEIAVELWNEEFKYMDHYIVNVEDKSI